MPADGHHNEGAERHEAKPVADATRAELSGISDELENAATDLITLLERPLVRATALCRALGERARGLDDAETRAHG